MKSRYQTACTNCKAPLPQQFVFQGVVICERCHKIVSHLVQRSRKELEMLFLTYTDMLRVALVKGEMNFPVLPKSKRMPGNEMQRAMHEMALKIGEEHEGDRPEVEGDHPLSALWRATTDLDGAVQGGGRPSALPRRVDVRTVPAVQEGGDGGDCNPERGAHSAGGLEGDTQ